MNQRLVLFLFALISVAKAGAMGQTAVSSGDYALSESMYEVVDAVWVEGFDAAYSEISANTAVPGSVTRMVFARMPTIMADLSPGYAAALVAREAVTLDHEIRKGVLPNRAVVASSARLREVAHRALRAETDRESSRVERGLPFENPFSGGAGSALGRLHAQAAPGRSLETPGRRDDHPVPEGATPHDPRGSSGADDGVPGNPGGDRGGGSPPENVPKEGGIR